MSIERILRYEIQESKRWIDKADGVYKRDLIKRIELINWVPNAMIVVQHSSTAQSVVMDCKHQSYIIIFYNKDTCPQRKRKSQYF